VDYTLEPILCRSRDPDTEQYFGEKVSRQAVLNQFNSNTFASISHLLSVKLGPKLPSLLSRFNKSKIHKSPMDIADDDRKLKYEYKILAKDSCSIILNNMSKKSKTDYSKYPSVYYVDPSKWDERTLSDVDQASAIDASKADRAGPENGKTPTKLREAMHYKEETLSEVQHIKYLLRLKDGSRILLAGEGYCASESQSQTPLTGTANPDGTYYDDGGGVFTLSIGTIIGDDAGKSVDVPDEVWDFLHRGQNDEWE